jgi:hypothetical protein
MALKYQEIAKLSVPDRRTRLSALVTTKDPNSDQLHEMAVLRHAVKRGWTPELEEQRDRRAAELAKKKAPAAEPSKKPIVAPTPPSTTPSPAPAAIEPPPVTRDVHVHVHPTPAPPSTTPTYIPTTSVGAVVHLAEHLLDTVLHPPLSARDIADEVFHTIHPVAPATGHPRSSGGPMPEPRPAVSSGITINTGDFVASIGAFILAAGIIGFMVWHFGGVEFLNILLYIFLPVFALLSVVGLMKWGTMKMLYNFELRSRVAAYLDDMRREAARGPSESVSATA